VSYRGKFSLIPCRNEFYVSVIDGYNVYVVPCRRTVYGLCHRPGKVREGWKIVMKGVDKVRGGGGWQRLKMKMLGGIKRELKFRGRPKHIYHKCALAEAKVGLHCLYYVERLSIG
jgi:hypothetical protein